MSQPAEPPDARRRARPPPGAPRLLVLRALGLGDLLTAVPALRALADALPGHRLLLACPRALAPLAELTGAVDEVVDAEPLAQLPDSLRGVEVTVNLHGRGPESHRLLKRLDPRRLIAFANFEAGVRDGPRWRADEHEVARWCRLLAESGIPADAGRLDLDVPPHGLPERWRGLTIVHPGAAAPARRWPAERFAAVARAEVAAGRRVAVTGSRAEAPLARGVVRRAGGATQGAGAPRGRTAARDGTAAPAVASLAGRTGPLQLAALVAGAGRVVCGDTGVAHLATALRTPSVVVCGPTPPALWGPPPDRPWHRALWAGVAGDPHADEPSPGLLAIGVADVLAALAGLPEATRLAHAGRGDPTRRRTTPPSRAVKAVPPRPDGPTRTRAA